MSDRLFDIDDVPEVPLLREPRRSRGEHDARFRNEYPEAWHRCPVCEGTGYQWAPQPAGTVVVKGEQFKMRVATRTRELPGGGWAAVGDEFVLKRTLICSVCLGMGSIKRKVRLLAGFRCERCRHPYLGKGDMTQLGKPELAVPHVSSPCDDLCTHGPPVTFMVGNTFYAVEQGQIPDVIEVGSSGALLIPRSEFRNMHAAWRILTVHHLDGDKANLAWWNLATLCQRCHLEIQAKVVMERVYPHEHSEWFKPHAAGYYAKVYLGEDVTLEEATARLDELLALEAA